MALIEWQKEFETGIPGIDLEHQELITMINSYETAIENNSSKHKLIAGLNDLYAAIYSHFTYEESVMEKNGYDQYKTHAKDHVKLLDENSDITEELEQTSKLDQQRLKDQLNGWFAVHFKTHDARLHKLEQLLESGTADDKTSNTFFKKLKLSR